VGAAFGLLFGAGPTGAIIALVFSGAMAFVSYWKADTVALAVSRAHPADPQQYQRLHNLVEGLCIAAGLPKPRVYIVDDPAPNAFATGRNPKHAAIAVTTGLLEKMNRVELEGVIAHELSHVRNYDILVSTLAVTLVGSIALLTNIGMRMMWWNGGRVRREGDRNGGNPLALVGLVLLIFAPIIAKLMQAAVSRRRETLADVSAVQMTRYPPGLISALEKLRADSTVTHSATTATAHMWIEQPMSGVGNDGGRFGALNRMFDTHPPLEERIALLREL
jgi:heat shock protein HtpX